MENPALVQHATTAERVNAICGGQEGYREYLQAYLSSDKPGEDIHAQDSDVEVNSLIQLYSTELPQANYEFINWIQDQYNKMPVNKVTLEVDADIILDQPGVVGEDNLINVANLCTDLEDCFLAGR